MKTRRWLWKQLAALQAMPARRRLMAAVVGVSLVAAAMPAVAWAAAPGADWVSGLTEPAAGGLLALVGLTCLWFNPSREV